MKRLLIKYKEIALQQKVLVGSLVFLILYSITLVSFATPPGSPYMPGETLDPNCLPGSSNCTVDITTSLPDTEIAFGTGTGLTSSNDFTWDDTNKSLRIDGRGGTDMDHRTIEAVGDDGTFFKFGKLSNSEGGGMFAFYLDSGNRPDSINVFANPEEGFQVVNGSSNLVIASNAFMFNGSPVGIGVAPSFPLDVDGLINTSTQYNIEGNFFGSQDTDSSTVRIGSGAGASITSGTANMLFGINAGTAITQSSYNTIIGNNAGISLTTSAGSNVFIGEEAGHNQTTGYENTFIGQIAGRANLSGQRSVAIGNSASYQGTSADRYVAIGYGALGSQIGAADNVAIGYSAGIAATGGTNVFIGSAAGYLMTSAQHNVMLGYSADLVDKTDSNNFVVGSSYAPIYDTYIGQGEVNVSPSAITFHGTGGLGTNIAGGDFVVASGKATGNASGGSIIFQTSDAGSSGSTLQSLSTKAVITAAGRIGLGTTSPSSSYKVHIKDSRNFSTSILYLENDYSVAGGAGITLESKLSGVSQAIASLQITGGLGGTFMISGTDIRLADTGGKHVYIGEGGSGSKQIEYYQGNLSIGGFSPTYRLDVLTATTDQTASNRVVNATNTNATFDTTSGALSSYAGYFNSISTRSSGANDLTNIGLYTSASGAQNNYGLIVGSGSVGIGDITPDYLLDVENTGVDADIFSLHDSDGECFHNPEAGSETVTCSSDERLKTNIADAEEMLPYLNDFHIRQYDVISGGDHLTGVIAQEVQTIHPELVTLGPDGYLSVATPSTWQLIKGIQELDIRISPLVSLDVNQSGSLGAMVKQFLSDAGNTISDIFTNKIHTKSLCVSDDSGNETCLDKNEIDRVLESLNPPLGGNAGNATSAGETTGGSTGEGEIIDDGGGRGGGVVENEEVPPLENPPEGDGNRGEAAEETGDGNS